MDGTPAITETAPAAAHRDGRRIRVAIFEPYIFDTVYGNTRYIATIFKFLDRDRVEPVLISPVEGRFLERIAELGGETRIVPAPGVLNRYGGALHGGSPFVRALAALALALYTYKLARFLAREKVDIVQCHDIRAMLMAGLAGKLIRRPVIWYVKGELGNPLLDRICLALANLVLFQGETNLARRYPRLVKRWRAKIEILRNGIDLGEVARAKRRGHKALRAELGLDAHKVNIVFVGQVMGAKGLEELIAAMAKLQVSHPDTTLHIVGDHCIEAYRPYRTHLELKIKVLGVTGVMFTGWREDVLDIVALMDVFVLPSFAEGVPKSVIEAMALGKPVIATTVGSVPDLVRDGETGLLVPPRDIDALAEALTRLVEDPALRKSLGERARAFAQAECAIEENIKGLERFYERLA